MKKAIAITIIALAASATGAFAKEITGTVSSVDKPGDSITLSDGKVIALPENIEVETISRGEKVRVVYFTNKNGKAEAKSVQSMK